MVRDDEIRALERRYQETKSEADRLRLVRARQRAQGHTWNVEWPKPGEPKEAYTIGAFVHQITERDRRRAPGDVAAITDAAIGLTDPTSNESHTSDKSNQRSNDPTTTRKPRTE